MRYAPVVLALLVSPHALAQQSLGLYVGIGLGNFQFEEDSRSLAANPAAGRPRVDEITNRAVTSVVGLRVPGVEDSALALKFYGGWNLTEFLGVEVSYSLTDKLATTYSTRVDELTVSTSIATEMEVGAARVMGYLPLGWGALFGGLGYFQANFSPSENVAIVVSGAADDSNAVTLGGTITSEKGPTALVGVEWSLASVAIRADYEWLDMGAADASTVGVGVTLRF